jgi:hypothetical protein
MTTASARLRAGFLRYTALQFVVLIAAAMWLYAGGTHLDPAAGGYQMGENFLSDLGLTHAWSGRANAPAAVLFGLALGGFGVGFVAFAGSWRGFAFARGRARGLGITAQLLGTAAGSAFIGVAVTPMDLQLDLHNLLVTTAFGLLLLYAIAITLVWWRNGGPRTVIAASVAYVLAVAAYIAVGVVIASHGWVTDHERTILVIAQKLVTAVSIAFVVYATTAVRRQLTSG